MMKLSRQLDFKKIHIIINPVAGIPRPVLSVIARAFKQEGVEWDISLLKDDQGARQHVERALSCGVDAIAVYGGDGTIMDVSNDLVGKKIPMIILPGGSANVLSVELGIPNDLAAACKLIFSEKAAIRSVDMGQMGSHHFLLRVSAGFEAEIVKATDRKLKTNVGRLAYALSGLKAIRKTRQIHYKIVLDDRKTIETDGLACVIANSGNLGLPGVTLSPKIKIDDGLLDVIVIRAADINSLFYLASNFKGEDIIKEFFQHWQAKKVDVDFNQSQSLHCDGEVWVQCPIHAKIIKHAVQIVVPQKKNVLFKVRGNSEKKSVVMDG